MWLLHGTTLDRAESIARRGPDVRFVEPGAFGIAENFSFTVEGAASAEGESMNYARGKAAAFPDERGPAIVAVDVPAALMRAAALEYLALFEGLVEYDEAAGMNELIDLCGGVVQFHPGPALDGLLAAWPSLAKEIRGVP